jgi:hypothetical protein
MQSLLRTLYFAVCLAVTSSTAVWAQTGPIEFQVDESRSVYRTGAPLQLRVKAICSASGILTGDLEIQVNDGMGGIIASVRISDLTYSAGRQEVDYLLPLQSHQVLNSIGFVFLFRETDAKTKKPSGPVHTSVGQIIPPRIRSLTAPIVRSKEAGEKATDDYEWLAIETYLPKLADNSRNSPMVTMLPRLVADDLPRDPLKHLVHDVVVVESSGFAELAGAQVQALESWVLGGGSLFLHLGAELPREQSEFVDRLLRRTPDLLGDEIEGTELIPVLKNGAMKTLDYGFGRVCLTTQRSWSRATNLDRRRAFVDLWRLRSEHRDAITQTGLLSLELIRNLQNTEWQQYDANSRMQLQQLQQMQSAFQQKAARDMELQLLLSSWELQLKSQTSPRPSQMIGALLPQDVRTVPIWLLSTIVLGYILYIGFGEYTVLDKIKKRRLTWFTFPIATLAITLLTIGTAKGYLGSSIEHNRVIVRDVSEDSLVCREQTFDLYFQGSTNTVSIPLQNEAFTPVANQPISNQPGYRPPQTLESGPVLLNGNPTGQASLIQTLQQWKPQLNRSARFPRDQKLPEAIAQSKFGTLPASASPVDVQQIRSTVPGAILYGSMNGSALLSVTDISQDQQWILCQTILAMSFASPSNNRTSYSGLFTLFDKISPSADIGLFDLVCSPDEELRVLAVREGADLVIYRSKVPAQP